MTSVVSPSDSSWSRASIGTCCAPTGHVISGTAYMPWLAGGASRALRALGLPAISRRFVIDRLQSTYSHCGTSIRVGGRAS